MLEPYLGEIMVFAGTFAPRGWAECNGALLSISQNSALFSLLGTTYGGDGQSTFALPDLRGRVPIGQGVAPTGTPYTIGEVGGVETVTLNNQQMPNHSHGLPVSSDPGTSAVPIAGGVLAAAGPNPGTLPLPYSNGGGDALLRGAAPQGGNQPHDNMQPYQAIRYCIAVEGIYPSRA